jgi:H+/Cl- antiporter ClcA
MLFVLLGCAVLLALAGFVVGQRVPPLVGQSENHTLWPSFVLIGLVGGALGNLERFRRK